MVLSLVPLSKSLESMRVEFRVRPGAQPTVVPLESVLESRVTVRPVLPQDCITMMQ